MSGLFLTASESAVLAGVVPATILRWSSAGLLPATYRDGRRLFAVGDVERLRAFRAGKSHRRGRPTTMDSLRRKLATVPA